ncbi:MAG TPA: alpha/beta fold hydrolase [Acidimicrobiales bacterium]|nr:alpha/beta fold hydrolase [Acidimicrobiales bacterium]
MTRLLLVHGAFHGGWCWERLLPELSALGVEAETIDLPFTTPDDDREAVASAVDRLGATGEPVVAVGHSFGGAVITAAAGGAGGRRAASHLVYLTAIMQEPGRPIDLGQTPGLAALRMEGETASVDPAGATIAFYHRCAPDDAERATARLRPMPTAVLAAPPPDHVAWRHVPSTYIVCTDDQIISPAQQRVMAAQAGARVEMDSDHSPFLSCPAELAGVLAGIAAGVT